jgi:hypothetical protein
MTNGTIVSILGSNIKRWNNDDENGDRWDGCIFIPKKKMMKIVSKINWVSLYFCF